MKNSALYATAMTELADAQMLPKTFKTFDAGIIVEVTPSASRICRKEFKGKLRVIAIVEPYKTGYMVNYASDWSDYASDWSDYASDWSDYAYDTEEEAIEAVNMESRSIDERGFI